MMEKNIFQRLFEMTDGELQDVFHDVDLLRRGWDETDFHLLGGRRSYLIDIQGKYAEDKVISLKLYPKDEIIQIELDNPELRDKVFYKQLLK